VGISLLLLFSLSNLSFPEQSGRRGRIPWSEVRTDAQSLIDPGFLLGAILENPTRMSLKDITAYWKYWVSKDKGGDPFSFLGTDDNSNNSRDSDKDKDSDKDEGNDKGKDDDDDDDGAGDLPRFSPDHFSIDRGIPYPFLCDQSNRTNCLEQLVSGKSQVNKTFLELVRMVDTMEVSPILSI